MDFDGIRERLWRLDTASLCDANKELRLMDPAIRPICLGLKLVGREHAAIPGLRPRQTW